MNQTTAFATLIYGPTRTYKSSSLALAAEYVYHTTGGRKTRLVSTETNAAEIYQPQIDAGIIEPFWLQRKHNIGPAIRKLCRGEWPAIDPNGGISFLPTPKEKWGQYGAYIFEGLTTIAERYLRDLADKARGVSSDKIQNVVYKEDNEVFGSSTLQQYGDVHKLIMHLITEAPKNLWDTSGGGTGWTGVQNVFFTAHQTKGEDEENNPIYGPATVGKAITGSIIKEMGLVLHHEEGTVTDPPATKGGVPVRRVEVRAYFADHPDPDNPNIIWKAGMRNAPSALVRKALLDKWPGGYYIPSLDPQMSLAEFLVFQDQLKKLASAEVMKRLGLNQPTPANPTPVGGGTVVSK